MKNYYNCPRLFTFVSASLCFVTLSISAEAQISTRSDPSVRTSDRVNVDVATGLPHWVVQDVQIGPETLGFSHSVRSRKASFLMPRDDYRDSVIITVESGCPVAWAGPPYLVSFRGVGECFYLNDGIFSSFDGKGTYLEAVPGGYLYTLSDGTKIKYSNAEGIYGYGLKRIEQPNGITTTVYYESNGSAQRVRSVEKNTGYRLYYRYGSEDRFSAGWGVFSGVTAYNAEFDACGPGSYCQFTRAWPFSSYVVSESAEGTTMAIIDSAGRSTEFSTDSSYQYNNLGRFNRVKLPSSDAYDIEYKYCPYDNSCVIIQYANGNLNSYQINDLVISAKQNNLTWTYGLTAAGPVNLERNSTGPNGYVVKLLTTNSGNLINLSSPEGEYIFSGGSGGHINTAPNPDGTSTSFVRDGRGNIVQFLRDGNVEQAVSYPTTCENRVTCNRPAAVTDANGNQTVYEYDPVHGGVVRATGPTVNGVTRETRYTYELRHAWYLNGAGSAVQDPEPVWLLVQESTCRAGPASGAGCEIAGDELRTVYERGPANAPGGLLLRGVVNDAAGTPSRTCYGYDRLGNRVSEAGPAAQLTSCS